MKLISFLIFYLLISVNSICQNLSDQQSEENLGEIRAFQNRLDRGSLILDLNEIENGYYLLTITNMNGTKIHEQEIFHQKSNVQTKLSLKSPLRNNYYTVVLKNRNKEIYYTQLYIE